MSVGSSNLAFADGRREWRDDVHYRARAFGPDAKQHTLLIVNVSPHGIMARCDAGFEIGDRIRIQLPVIGVAVAEIRWSLGGRLGAQFESAIDLASYYELISTLMRSNRP